MVKCSGDLMLVKLGKLFNKTFKTGCYTNSWNEGLIFSIHKSGEKENLNNYRGITLSNSFDKLLNTKLYHKITTKLAQFYLQHKPDFVRTIERQIIPSLFLVL